MTSSEYVNVPVPSELVVDVYQFIAQRQQALAAGGHLPAAAETAEVPASKVLSGPEVDRALVTRMYQESEPPHRRLMRHLAASSGEWIPTKVVAEELGLPKGGRSLAGSLGAFGRRSVHRYSGRWPFAERRDPGTRQSQLRMDPDVAKIILEVAKEGDPPNPS